jgi:hypothetical protein
MSNAERDWEVLNNKGEIVAYVTTTEASLVLARRAATAAADGNTVRLAYYGDITPNII